MVNYLPTFNMKTSLLVCATCVVFVACSSKLLKNQSRFDNYRLYRILLETEKQVDVFKAIEKRSDSFQFYGNPRKTGQKINVLIAAHKIAEMTDLLETFGVEHEILTYNLQEKIDAEEKFIMPKNSSPDKFNWDNFFQLDSIYAWMDKLAEDYDHVSVINMGVSHEGNPIKGIRIGNNPNNTAVFIESGIHAREWIAPATATFIINELLTSNNETVKKYSTNFNWFIFPVLNVDGYLYTFSSDRMWRKNRNLFGSCRGVDLNRNFPYRWNETGSSPDPCQYDYAGPASSSEAESQRLTTFLNENVQSNRIKTYIALHSYSQLIMFPYGTPEKVDNFDDLKAIGLKAADAIENISGRKYLSGSIYDTIYPSSGCSQDWAHAIAKIPITFTFELRGAPDSNTLFILPADEIKPTAQEIFAAVIAILREAESLGYYDSEKH